MYQLAKKYGTDKLTHKYIEHYEKIFKNIKNDEINLLEIGVREGWSHLMWRDYFTYGNIYGIDNYSDPVFKVNEKKYNFDNIKVFIGDQTDEAFLNNNITFDLDVIIDDGGHKMSHQQLSLKYLFKKLKSGGYYIIEDLHTSHRQDFLDVPDIKFSTLNFLKNISTLTNDTSFFIKGDDLKYIQQNIKNIHIYNDKICIIQKTDTKRVDVYVDGIAGLGNSIFQIATAIYYTEKFNCNLILTKNNTLKFGTCNIAGRNNGRKDKSGECITYDRTILSKFNWVDNRVTNHVTDVFNNYTDNKIVPNNDIRIKGYCQNINLFKEYLHCIPKYLKLDDSNIINYVKSKYKNIENGIFIGLRVGNDFSHMRKINRDSYKLALNKLKNDGINIDNLFIISDVKNAWEDKFDLNSEFPATDIIEDDITQLYAGMLCEHYILSESTYHLWIAYLGTVNKPDKKVIVFNDTDLTNRKLTLDNWVKIEYHNRDPIYYGTTTHNKNITGLFNGHFIKDNNIHIPKNVNFNSIFGDPVPGIEKRVYITTPHSENIIIDQHRTDDVTIYNYVKHT